MSAVEFTGAEAELGELGGCTRFICSRYVRSLSLDWRTSLSGGAKGELFSFLYRATLLPRFTVYQLWYRFSGFIVLPGLTVDQSVLVVEVAIDRST